MANQSGKAKYSAKTPLLVGSGEDSDSLEAVSIAYDGSNGSSGRYKVDDPARTSSDSDAGSPTKPVTGSPDTSRLDCHHSYDNSSSEPNFNKRYVYSITFFSVIGGFLFGYDTGVISGAMIFLRQVFELNAVWQEVIVSLTIGAAALFSPVGGILNDNIGRRKTIIIASCLFTAGSVILAASINLEMLLVGRATLGIAIGLASSTIPMYMAECSPYQMRGRLVTSYNVSIVIGQFIAAILDGAFSYISYGWRFMLGLAAIPAAIEFFGMIFMPESPRYLVQKGRLDEARKVLQQLTDSGDVTTQLNDIKQSIDENRSSAKVDGNILCRILTTQPVRRALLVGCGMQLIQQLIGINTIMYYSATIIKMSGVTSDSAAIWLAALTAGVNALAGVIGLFFVERVGRRNLSLGSLAGVFISLVVLAIGFQIAAFQAPPITVTETGPPDKCSSYRTCDTCTRDPSCGFCFDVVDDTPANGSCTATLHDSLGNYYMNTSMYGRCEKPDDDTVWAYEYCPTHVAWMATFGLVLYLAAFSPGMGPMPWTVNSEIYPTWARSTGNATATMVNWIANLIVSMTFLSLTQAITMYGTFWLYSGVAFLGFVFLYKMLPETKSKTLEEIEILFVSS